MTKKDNLWTFLNWIVYFKFNINIETFKNSDQVWKQNYKFWAPGPSLVSGGKHKKRKGKQSLRILYYFCVNTLVLLLHSPPTIQNCWVLWRNWIAHQNWQSRVTRDEPTILCFAIFPECNVFFFNTVLQIQMTIRKVILNSEHLLFLRSVLSELTLMT